MTEAWNVELHSHTYWSTDCMVKFETIMRVCEERGIDRIAITDHNTADGALAFQKIAPELVIVGEEIFTTQGELLAFFVQETIPKGLTPEETINRLRDQGAFISVSHPFDQYRKGAWRKADLDRIIDRVDAIETFNARCLSMNENALAQDYAAEHNLCGTTGSDAHTPVEYGTATQRMQPFSNVEEFRASLQTAEPVTKLSSPSVHFNSTLAKWSRKLGFSKRPRP
ncbi:MAG: PHP domain-containing protein [Chloroflexota bacterium]